MRIIGGMIVFGVLLFAGIHAASAAECDDFNLLRFHPSELQRCIDQISGEVRLQQMEIQNLDIEVCTLSMKLDQVSPGDDLAATFCPHRKAKRPLGKSPKQ